MYSKVVFVRIYNLILFIMDDKTIIIIFLSVIASQFHFIFMNF